VEAYPHEDKGMRKNTAIWRGRRVFIIDILFLTIGYVLLPASLDVGAGTVEEGDVQGLEALSEPRSRHVLYRIPQARRKNSGELYLT
jgi:hypothetical protein